MWRSLICLLLCSLLLGACGSCTKQQAEPETEIRSLDERYRNSVYVDTPTPITPEYLESIVAYAIAVEHLLFEKPEKLQINSSKLFKAYNFEDDTPFFSVIIKDQETKEKYEKVFGVKLPENVFEEEYFYITYGYEVVDWQLTHRYKTLDAVESLIFLNRTRVDMAYQKNTIFCYTLSSIYDVGDAWIAYPQQVIASYSDRKNSSETYSAEES
ncbi:MAG: hypothetical protein ACK5LX_08510 [Oscillospiraceae bacterium]